VLLPGIAAQVAQDRGVVSSSFTSCVSPDKVRAVYGDRFSRVVTLRGMTVHTNLEAAAIILATGFAGRTLLEAALIIASFALGTALHLACHLGVATAFGKGIDRMILTRAGRIDYSGAPPGFVENVLRTGAGATMNALCAIVGYAVLARADVSAWPPVAALALHTFARCSLILTMINFLPAVPLDGGLILKSVLERFIGEAQAMRTAVLVSMVLMAAMAVVGAVFLQPVLIYVAAVISYDNWRKYLRAPLPQVA
jgi:Zn-dependent protease